MDVLAIQRVAHPYASMVKNELNSLSEKVLICCHGVITLTIIRDQPRIINVVKYVRNVLCPKCHTLTEQLQHFFIHF